MERIVETKVERFGTDIYFSMVRLGFRITKSEQHPNGEEFTTEDFEFFLPFDPNNKPSAAVIEAWVEEKKKAAKEQFLDGKSVAPQVVAAVESNTRSSVDAGDSPAPSAVPNTEVEATKKRGRPAKVAPAAPAVEEAPAPAPVVEETPVAAEPAPVVEAKVEEMVVYYDKANREHALLVQRVLDEVEPSWKTSTKAIEFAKAIVAKLHGTQIIMINGKPCTGTLQLVASSFKAKDLGLWDAAIKAKQNG